tara:strand:- start:45 stop:281 length:237 start_codon:yes stop_codon:yes gene_type:complete
MGVGNAANSLLESAMNSFLKIKGFALSLHKHGYLFIPLLLLIGIGFYLLLIMIIRIKLGWEQENFTDKKEKKKTLEKV